MVEVEGRGEFTIVTQKTSWIQEMLSGRKSDVPSKDRLTSLLKELLKELKAKGAEADAQAAEVERRRPARRPEAADELNLTEDEDDAEDASDEEKQTNANDRRAAFPNTFRVTTVTVNDYDITFAYFKRKYYVAATQANLDAFVQAANSYGKPEVAKRKAERSENRREGSSPTGSQKKAVRWCAARDRYIIYYTNSEGESKQYSQGLAPKVQNESGRALSKAEYAAELKRVWAKARRTWNELDKSDKPRLTEE